MGVCGEKNLEDWQETKEKVFFSIKATWKSLYFALSEKAEKTKEWHIITNISNIICTAAHYRNHVSCLEDFKTVRQAFFSSNYAKRMSCRSFKGSAINDIRDSPPEGEHIGKCNS